MKVRMRLRRQHAPCRPPSVPESTQCRRQQMATLSTGNVPEDFVWSQPGSFWLPFIGPLEISRMATKHKRSKIIVAAVAVAGILLFRTFNTNDPVDYSDILEHFKYGSIGSEIANGFPKTILKVLPTIFRDKLPGDGLASLGFIQEDGKEFPVGFSQRRVVIDRVWLNCGVCHTGSVRATPSSPRHVYAGMPANTMTFQALIRFLVAAASDERFTVENLMTEIKKTGDLGFFDRLIYRYVAIKATRERLLEIGKKIEFMSRQPEWGPGRVDTFNPYKAVQFNFPMSKIPDEEIVGTTDLPSIWLQRNRQGMQLHWDGDNVSVEERNKSAALGAGVTPVTIDLPRIKRIEDWLLHLEPPRYPFGVNEEVASSGQRLYQEYCSACHGADGRDFK